MFFERGLQIAVAPGKDLARSDVAIREYVLCHPRPEGAATAMRQLAAWPRAMPNASRRGRQPRPARVPSESEGWMYLPGMRNRHATVVSTRPPHLKPPLLVPVKVQPLINYVKNNFKRVKFCL